MAKTVQSQGNYKAPNGQEVTFPFSFNQFDSLQDAVATLGEPAVLKQVQRMEKIDAGNTAREAEKVKNGHSTRKVQTEEQKAEAKAERASNKALLDALKSKGIKSLDDLSKL